MRSRRQKPRKDAFEFSLQRCSRNREAFLGMREDGFDLLGRYAWKPFKEIAYCRAVFDVLKQRHHRYACSFEQPRATHFSRHTLNSGTFVPIQHGITLPLNDKDDKACIKLIHHYGWA